MQHPFKEFFYFSRGERRGILVLITGIILVFLIGYSYSHRDQPLSDEEIRQQALAEAEYEAFIATIQEEEKNTEKPYYRYPHEPQPAIEPVSFNPNTADSITFRSLGLPGWMARNILHYRAKGGKFRKAEDFKKIYGLTAEQYQALLPYIYIAPEDTARHIPRLYTPSVASDSITSPQAALYKYPEGAVVDLNCADTTELKKIPGIGSGIARLITGYRQRLGGFYSIEQLQDIHVDYHPLQSWLRIDSKDIHPLNLNRAGIEKLRNHPYINFYQAKAFVEYRKKKGTLRNLKPFALYEEFSATDLERISHYVCFE
ncbi:MAG: helix-hairpin-helix domain-containing protein [Bacteroides sp.]|nr:helix-hairpin-helix domain-containing protein [Bacteroides sp.]